MPLLHTVAQGLSTDDMVRGVIEEFIHDEALFALLPYVPTEGKAYVYNREKTLATGNWLDTNEEVKEGASEFKEVTTNLRILIGDVDVDKFLQTTMSNVNNQKAIQIASKVKGMAGQFKDALINGSTENKQFDGINRLVVAERIIGAGENPLALTMLDELKDAVKLGATAIMMRGEHVRVYKQLMRTFGGNTGLMMQIDNFGKPVLSFDGVPILTNEYIQKRANKAGNGFVADIFAVRCNESDGLHGIYSQNSPAGFVIEDLGTVQNKDATRTRIKQYTGLALKATHSLAKVGDVAL